MPEAPDPIGMMQEAFAEGADRYKEAVRMVRADMVQRPLDPTAHKLKGADRKAADAQFLADPELVAAEADAQTARFNLPAEKPIPRRVWQRIKRAAKEAE